MNHDQFLDNFGTRTGRWLANRLNLRGTGSVKLADLLSCYAWNKRAANTLAGIYEMKGQNAKNAYDDYCNILRQDIENHPLYSHIRMRLNFW